jgi:hypothetical protein
MGVIVLFVHISHRNGEILCMKVLNVIPEAVYQTYLNSFILLLCAFLYEMSE